MRGTQIIKVHKFERHGAAPLPAQSVGELTCRLCYEEQDTLVYCHMVRLTKTTKLSNDVKKESET
jgi:hypothetical protein